MKKGGSVMMVRMKVLAFGLFLVFCVGVIVPSIIEAGEPCCNVTAINAKAGLVTAKNAATGETLQFTLDNAAAISKVKVGAKVSIDTMSGKVIVHGAEPISGIIKPAEPPSSRGWDLKQNKKM